MVGWSRIRWLRWLRSRWSGSDHQGGQGQTIKAVKVKVKMGKVVMVVKLNEARWSRGSWWWRSDRQGQGSSQMVKVMVQVRWLRSGSMSDSQGQGPCQIVKV